MPETSMLAGKRILIVEDEYLVARDTALILQRADCEVVGPVSDVASAQALLAREPIDGAVLDIQLGEQTAYPIADALIDRGIPFLFTTGYDRSVLPSEYATAPALVKPYSPRDLAKAVARAIHGNGTDRGKP